MFTQAINEANEVALEAGNAWMENALNQGPAYSVHNSDVYGNKGRSIGTMLDMCGNAHVVCSDKRTKFAKWLIEHYTGTYTTKVPIHNKFKHRQEYGLQCVMAEAVIKLLEEKYAIKKLRIWEYVD